MKKIITIFGILCSVAFSAQSSSLADTMKSKGYILLPKEQGSGKALNVNSATTEFYDGEGKLLTKMEGIGKLSAGGNNTVDLYVDKDKNIRALVIRPAAEGEKKAMVQGSSSALPSSLLVGQPVPAFDLTGTDGKKYTSEQLKGKIVVINFWFEKCKPCLMELPELNAVAESYKNSDEVVFLAVTFDNQKDIDKFLKKNRFIYNKVADQKDMIQQYGITMFPTHLIIDRDGILAYNTSGFSEGIGTVLRENIIKVLQKDQ